MANQVWHPQRVRFIRWFFDVVGGVSLLAFGAAFMPAKWFGEISEELGLAGFPEDPLAYYLARNLSLLYGFVALVLITVARDLERSEALVTKIAWGTLLFGALPLVVDNQARMPLWWSLGEGLSTVFGGLFLLWLNRFSRLPPKGS